MCAFVPKCNFSLSGQNVHRKDLWHNAISACDILHLKSLICHFPLFIDYMSFMPFSILVFCLLIDIIILFCSFESMSCFAFRFERHWLSHLTSISVLVWKLTFKDSQGSRKLKVLIFKRSDFLFFFFHLKKADWEFHRIKQRKIISLDDLKYSCRFLVWTTNGLIAFGWLSCCRFNLFSLLLQVLKAKKRQTPTSL